MNAKVFGLYESILKSGKLAWWDVRQKKALLNEIRKLMAPTENRWNFRWVILGFAFRCVRDTGDVNEAGRGIPDFFEEEGACVWAPWHEVESSEFSGV